MIQTMRGGIAILTALFPPSVGGIQTQTLALARGLAAGGAEVHVVTRPAAGRPSREEIDGVTVHRAGIVRGPNPARTAAYVGLAARIVSALGNRVAVAHAHQMLSPASAALVARAVRGLPFVVTAHASGSIGEVAHLSRQGPLGRIRLSALARLASAFVAVSAPIHDELIGAGIPDRRIRRIPNGVDTRRFAPADPGERARLRAMLGLPAGPVAIYSGRLAPEKGPDVLLDAWAETRRRRVDATLCLVGEGPARAALEARAARLGVASSVRFTGAREDVAAWLRAADAFVLPSRAEGLSVALLEAMACALPIVATDVGGTRDAAGEGALLVPPERPGELAGALAAALAGGEGARALGEAGRARVVERYGIERVAARHLELYAEVLEARR